MQGYAEGILCRYMLCTGACLGTRCRHLMKGSDISHVTGTRRRQLSQRYVLGACCRDIMVQVFVAVAPRQPFHMQLSCINFSYSLSHAQNLVLPIEIVNN